MPANGGLMGQMMVTKVDANMRAINGKGPLALLSDQSYYREFLTAVAKGFADGTININFTTTDTGQIGTPAVAGVGTGTGIKVDSEYLTQTLYTAIRNRTQAFGKTLHDQYPPSAGNSGKYLEALCRGIAEAVRDHYIAAWILNSTHSQVYAGSGQIPNGGFSGLSPERIKGLILQYSPRLKGAFWPIMAEEIARGYVKAIHERSTGQVSITGTCTPGPGQLCGLGGSGSGTGVAS